MYSYSLWHVIYPFLFLSLNTIRIMLCGFKSFGFASVFLSYPQTQLVNSCEHFEVAYFLIAFLSKKNNLNPNKWVTSLFANLHKQPTGKRWFAIQIPYDCTSVETGTRSYQDIVALIYLYNYSTNNTTIYTGRIKI